jgi:hypothetical protein
MEHDIPPRRDLSSSCPRYVPLRNIFDGQNAAIRVKLQRHAPKLKIMALDAIRA